jgi:hyperosmotically inducible protein
VGIKPVKQVSSLPLLELGDNMRILHTKKQRLITVLPTLALLLTAALAGCNGKEDDTQTAPPTASPTMPMPSGPSTAGTNPAGTPGTAPGGPGGTMMNKPSANPNGEAGDVLITAKVKSALIADTQVGATGINVDTKSGTVVLRGKVKTAAAKQAAMADAKKMQGVKNVIDQLAVAP